jgi:hypothetical protein
MKTISKNQFYNLFDKYYLQKGVNKWKYLNITFHGKGRAHSDSWSLPSLNSVKIHFESVNTKLTAHKEKKITFNQ